jgi:hypothetical protein
MPGADSPAEEILMLPLPLAGKWIKLHLLEKSHLSRRERSICVKQIG